MPLRLRCLSDATPMRAIFHYDARFTHLRLLLLFPRKYTRCLSPPCLRAAAARAARIMARSDARAPLCLYVTRLPRAMLLNIFALRRAPYYALRAVAPVYAQHLPLLFVTRAAERVAAGAYG